MAGSDGPSAWSLMLLWALQDKPMYLNTVPKAEVRRRRARNKRAKIARRLNRRG